LRAKLLLSKVQLLIQRFDPKTDRVPHYDKFEVSTRPGMTVLDALFQVLEEEDRSLAFRYSCRSAVCGSCSLFINGRPRLACETQLAKLSSMVTIGPLPHLPVIRDLVVDLHSFYQKSDTLKLCFEAREPFPEREFIQTPKEREAMDTAIDCIDCAACFSSCPMAWTDPKYPGPAAFVRAYRFFADSRDAGGIARLRAIGCEDGLWRCHTVFNCADACPKSINPTYFIQKLKRNATKSSFGKLRLLQTARGER